MEQSRFSYLVVRLPIVYLDTNIVLVKFGIKIEWRNLGFFFFRYI